MLSVGKRGSLRLYELLAAGVKSNKKQWDKSYNLNLYFSDKNNFGHKIHSFAMTLSNTTLMTGDWEYFKQTTAVCFFCCLSLFLSANQRCTSLARLTVSPRHMYLGMPEALCVETLCGCHVRGNFISAFAAIFINDLAVCCCVGQNLSKNTLYICLVLRGKL